VFAAGRADDGRLGQLERYAKCIGLAFQVHDDILDVEGETAVLGKTRGKDAAADKATYPALLGLQAARDMAQRLIDESLQSISGFGTEADPLRQLARYIIGRKR
jgi:geranylgeranyl diphosphate synthase type II